MLKHDDIVRVAHKLGFAACGATHIHLVPDEIMAHYDAWLAAGYAAGMEYMHRHREIRRDPTLLLPNARTMVCLAMGYTPEVEIEGIAHYAYGNDYHDVVRERGNVFVHELLSDDTTTEYRVCVDTAPIFERYWAVECGLGWIGRNKQLIVPHAGSEFFLCEVLLTDDIDQCDTPIGSHCGTCRKCIDACPTKALRSDGFLDSRLCNSYLTIEHRGEWTDRRPSPGCIYGCDACQRACPHQQFATPTKEPRFQPSDALKGMTADDWKHLTEEQFRELFRHSAVKRAKYAGFMRNVSLLQTPRA